MVTYAIYMKELSASTGWQDVTHAIILDKGIPIRKGFGSLSDAIDVGSVSLTVRMESLQEAALLHVSQKQVLIQADGVTIFEGLSYDDADVDLNMNTNYVYAKLKFKPYSSAFEKATVPEDTVLTDVKVCDPTDTVNSLVHILFGMIVDNLPGQLADIVSGSYSISTTISNTKVLELVILEKGESIEDYLTDVLYQNGYAYYMDLFSIVVIEPYQDGRTVTQGLQITEILAKPKISQAPYIADKKVVVRFPRVEQYTDETVYELNTEREKSGEPSQVDVIEPGAFYPLDSDGEPITMEADYETERETDDIELVHTAGRTLSYVVRRNDPEDPESELTLPASVVVDEKELGVLSATFKLYNNNAYQVSLRNVVVKATTSYYRNWIAKYDDPSVVSSDLDEIDGVYMADADTAKAFVKRYGAETRAQRTQVTFQTHLVIAPNALIEIAGLPYQLLVRYRTEANDGTGYIEYDCVAYLVEDVAVGGKVAVVPKRTPRDGSSPIPVRLYALGDDSAPFEDSERIADDTYVLADDYGAVGIDNAWGETRPTPGEGQYVWYKIGYYTPPATWPLTWTTPVRDEGLSAYALQISAPEGTTIKMSGRGVLRTASLKFTAILSNVLPASVVWAASNGTLNTVVGEDYSRTLDCSTVSADSVTITITATVGSHTYSASIGVQRVFGTIVPANLHTVTALPTSVGDEPLANGDYFLVGATFTEGATTYVKGQIWEYQNSSWVLSTDQSKAMSLLGDFADLEVDVESTVMNNAIIKKLIALDVTVQNLQAQNLRVREGTAGLPSILSFDGIDDYVSIPYNSALYPTQLRVEVSGYRTDWQAESSQGKRLISCTQGGGWSIYVDQNNLVFNAYINGAYLGCDYAVSSLSAGWHDIVGTYDGRYLKLYVDDVLVDTTDAGASYPITYSITDGILIGAEMGADGVPYPDSFYAGYLKDIAVYSDAAGTTPVATWGMQEGTGATVYDGTNTHEGTIHGATWIIEGGTGFEFHALTEDSNGRPRFGTFYNGRPIFVVQPDTGVISFGEHFWYDPSDGSIHTPGDKTVIRADGVIEAIDVDLTGVITALAGLFKGQIDCPSFASLQPSSGTVLNISAGTGASTQFINLYNDIVGTLPKDTRFTATNSQDGSVAYISHTGTNYPPNQGDYYEFRFYSSAFVLLGTVRASFSFGGTEYSSTYASGALSVSITYGDGDVFKFKDIPSDPTGLESGQVYRDGTTLKIVT